MRRSYRTTGRRATRVLLWRMLQAAGFKSNAAAYFTHIQRRTLQRWEKEMLANKILPHGFLEKTDRAAKIFHSICHTADRKDLKHTNRKVK